MAGRLKSWFKQLNTRVPSLRGLGDNFWQPLLIVALIAVPVVLVLSSAESLSAEINHVEARSDANQEIINELTEEKMALLTQLDNKDNTASDMSKQISALKKQNAELKAQVQAYQAEEAAKEEKKDKKKHDDDCNYWKYWECKDD